MKRGRTKPYNILSYEYERIETYRYIAPLMVIKKEESNSR